MSEEIKEKIDKSKENHRYNITSSREWFENLLDYIANLQQENKQPKEEVDRLKENVKQYIYEHRLYQQELDNYKTILSELEEWLKSHLDDEYYWSKIYWYLENLKEKYKC